VVGDYNVCITSRRLRQIIREALHEKKYHESVHVKGYEREGCTMKDGTKVKATYVRPHKSERERNSKFLVRG
jgi:hypothetical protein